MNAKHWSTKDGHRHVSIPTEVPEAWKQRYTDKGLIYFSGDYKIIREPYASRHTYAVWRNEEELPLGSLYGRLKDAKARAVKNAMGNDVMNMA